MDNRRAMMWAYVLVAASGVILVLSILALYQAMQFLQAGQNLNALTFGLMGVVGITLSISSITNMRKRMVFIQHVAAKVLSQVICASCGFKVVRTFSTGDFVTKEVGQCQQCKGSMRVETIYAEDMKPKQN
ncbi:MAG TPA: hypothetical protein VLV31_09690 [Candidatus Acidoferrales bacterium]|nr:hypothetical protein [Candidatus Acidoferrales bacterium]